MFVIVIVIEFAPRVDQSARVLLELRSGSQQAAAHRNVSLQKEPRFR